MIIRPALLLPLRFIDTTDINESFDGNFANEQAPAWQMGDRCYLQKYQRNDKLTLQIISEEVPTDLKILTQSGQVITTIEWTASDLTLLGFPDYVIYEIDFLFSSLQEGVYVIQQDNYEAQAIDLRDEHPNTILISYRNDVNDNDVVFDTGIEFQFRVDGGIGNYTPKNNRDVYVNQIYNPSQLKSIAHRQFTLYVGFQDGVPEWVLDKVNIITQCNEVFYDGVQYQPINDAEFEVIRADEITIPVAGTIDIEPTNNFIKFVTGSNPQQQTVRIVRRTHELLNISGNQTVSNVFLQASKLQEIVVYKTGADFTLSVGITPNGNEISEELVDSNNGYTILVNWAFNEPTTIYLSGVGLNADSLYLVYDQMNAPEIPLNASASDELGKGAECLFNGTLAEFNAAFDQVTGLGKPNTKWVKWCVSGTNGTIDRSNSYTVGIDVNQVGQDYVTLGNSISANNKKITKAQLPANIVNLPNSSVSGLSDNANDRAVMIPAAQQTLNVGGDGADFNVQPLSIISVYITKLVD